MTTFFVIYDNIADQYLIDYDHKNNFDKDWDHELSDELRDSARFATSQDAEKIKNYLDESFVKNGEKIDFQIRLVTEKTYVTKKYEII